jgi:hypothetical protein
MVNDIEDVLTLTTSLPIATCQFQKYLGVSESFTFKRRHDFRDVALLAFETQAFYNARRNPIPFNMRIPCCQHWKWLDTQFGTVKIK